MQQQPLTPLIIELTDPVTEEITVADVLVGALNFSGVIVLGAVLLALLFAGALIGLRRLSPSNPLNGDASNRTRLDLHLPSR
ncbi:MAG: hypothetical protein E2P06_04615 [Acidobacteria bacterium]|nr:hypothetical protein [Acidobacteriota bacterium]TDI19098.1 MAG: hypothetical protein E2P06_16635 [Acidobacteriota bacterium]TDI25534.1 MAG: hypothetical protein E2P06_04615 [Acidobacteriota bacterium]